MQGLFFLGIYRYTPRRYAPVLMTLSDLEMRDVRGQLLLADFYHFVRMA